MVHSGSDGSRQTCDIAFDHSCGCFLDAGNVTGNVEALSGGFEVIISLRYEAAQLRDVVHLASGVLYQFGKRSKADGQADGIDFDFSKCRLIDVQTIFHKMERRNLAAAYKFYCGHKMEDDFEAHRADQDTEATYRVLLGQLDYYTEEHQRELGEDPTGRVLSNDMQVLADFSKVNDNVDFAGRIIWADVKGQRTEVFNFGKHKGVPVADVLRFDPGYYSWILGGDFTYNTKQVLTRIRLREANK